MLSQKYTNFVYPLKVSTVLPLAIFDLYVKNSIGYNIYTHDFSFGSRQWTVPQTTVDMYLRTSFEKKVGSSWTTVKSLDPVRSWAYQLQQSNTYHATSSGTYRTAANHKIYSEGIIVLNVTDYSDEMTIII